MRTNDGKPVVVLTRDEMEEAIYTGGQRRLNAIFRKHKPRDNETRYWKQHWYQSDIIGALAEIAVSKALRLQWYQVKTDWSKPDVGPYEVRATEKPDAGLKVRTRDSDKLDRTFILAQVHNEKVMLHGHMTGHEVMAQGTEVFPNCWEVPATALHGIDTLPHNICWSDAVYPHSTRQTPLG